MLFTASALLDELFDVLSRPKFVERLQIFNASPESIVEDYAALAEAVIVTEVLPVIAEDADDDQVIACAIAVRADYIVSGDRHLLALVVYNSIQILNAAQFMTLFE
jgi:putative PIN family toxin of toxin-antitoxin system